ncbi:Nitrilase [Lachnellula willkommii]|uniref:Nitrilase n=1 Tax=Lachnellula willkommii TaxID=215461 RepID=A0A559MAH6_9HELO|nr:Nitrilase [Lachnellula willkommii]
MASIFAAVKAAGFSSCWDTARGTAAASTWPILPSPEGTIFSHRIAARYSPARLSSAPSGATATFRLAESENSNRYTVWKSRGVVLFRALPASAEVLPVQYLLSEQIRVASWLAFFEGSPMESLLAGWSMALEGQCFVSVSTRVVRRRIWILGVLDKFAGGFAKIYGPDGKELVEASAPGEERILQANIVLSDIDFSKALLDPVGLYSRLDMLSLPVNAKEGKHVVEKQVFGLQQLGIYMALSYKLMVLLLLAMKELSQSGDDLSIPILSICSPVAALEVKINSPGADERAHNANARIVDEQATKSMLSAMNAALGAIDTAKTLNLPRHQNTLNSKVPQLSNTNPELAVGEDGSAKNMLDTVIDKAQVPIGSNRQFVDEKATKDVNAAMGAAAAPSTRRNTPWLLTP